MTAAEGGVSQTLVEACERFVGWLDSRVTATGRGDGQDHLDVNPAGTFWLGRLAAEETVLASALGDRGERLDPCAIGVRFRPRGLGPWTIDVTVRLRAWVQNIDKSWSKLDPIEQHVTVAVNVGDDTVGGGAQLARALADSGASGLSAEVRVEVERWHGEPELVVQLINTSPATHPHLSDTHLYETSMTVTGIATLPFQLTGLPDSFRVDRRVAAYGVNVGVNLATDSATGLELFTTTDTVTVDTRRPRYWNSPVPEPDLRFTTLAADPIPPLRMLVDALAAYDRDHWSTSVLDQRGADEHWSTEMRAEADEAAVEILGELNRLRRGLQLIEIDPTIRRSFELMNRAIAHSAAPRGYDQWRPFQIGFLLTTLNQLADRAGEADVVDTVWFATGGGKTETYLGLLVTTAFHDRLTGKSTGITAWSRFPLRLLSLQQTQRFADALAGAELVRRQEGIAGDPFSLGFFVGATSTPNAIVEDAGTTEGGVDPESSGMPDAYQVLLVCPFCHRDDLTMVFDRRLWKLAHVCPNPDCPWPEPQLPFYVVDQEIYRFLPTVVLGTLDKAASIGMQAAMRGFVGPPQGICDQPGHGHLYAKRKKTPDGCLVPGCRGHRLPLTMPRSRYAPSLRLQDELHLLRDSLGAVDSHYESLLDGLQEELGAPRPKIVASSATLTGYERQVKVLYNRSGRVFPQPGARAGDSFWTVPGPDPLRRFVAVAPRGVTLEHVSDRTVDVLQRSVRDLRDDPAAVCATAGIDPVHADRLLDLYGTDVVYGSTLYDVEAASRSLASNSMVAGVNSVQLTGGTDFDDVRKILDQLEHPEPEFDDRVHVVTASSMLSHGVDIDRLNVMVMLGLPLSTAEFIQTTARVGRALPGLVYVLHKIGRERDAQTFRQFATFVRQGDRFVEPIPITRRSRRVLEITLPGIVEARRLAVEEPRSAGQRLTMIKMLRDYVNTAAMTPAGETELVVQLLGFTADDDRLLQADVQAWFDQWFMRLEDPASQRVFPNELLPSPPMRSLRDVEVSVPIHD